LPKTAPIIVVITLPGGYWQTGLELESYSFTTLQCANPEYGYNFYDLIYTLNTNSESTSNVPNNKFLQSLY